MRDYPGVCVIADCEREKRTRGLCARCYGTMLREITEGRRTWDQLEKAGLASQPRNRQGPAMAALAKAFGGKRHLTQRGAK